MTKWPGVIFHAMIAAFLFLHTGPARADCDLSIKGIKKVSFGGHSGRGYEVFGRQQFAETVEFTVENNKGACNFFIGFSAGGGSNFNARKLAARGHTLAYQLYSSVNASEVLKDHPIADGGEVLSGSVSPGQRRVTFRFFFLIPFEQVVPPGAYSDTVVMHAYEGTVQSASLRDQKSLDLSAEVLPMAEFCLGDAIVFTAGYRNRCVDFGNLVVGKVQDLMVHVRTNTGFRMTFRSQNGGTLESLDPRDDSRIPYRFTINGREVPLSGKQAVVGLQGSDLTSAFGAPYQLRFAIGDLEGASAGEYRDIIELTLYPQR